MSGAGRSGRRAEEAAGLGQVRAERAAALLVQEREVLRREDPEERRHVADVVEVRHRVVLEVAADRQLLAHLDPERLQLLAEPDAGEHQQHRRLVRARREDHLALGADRLALPPADELDADGAVPLEDDPLDVDGVAHLQVRPVDHRVEIRVGGAAAEAAALRELEAADAVLLCTVQVVVRRVAGLHGRLEHQVDERVHRTAVGDGLRAADAVVLALAALVVLAALEVRQHLVVAPARRAARRPVVVVEAVAAQVDHRVDRAAAADHAAAREVQPPVPQAGLLVAGQVPVQVRLEHDREHRRDVDLRRVVGTARLEQEDAHVRVLASAAPRARSPPSRRR